MVSEEEQHRWGQKWVEARLLALAGQRGLELSIIEWSRTYQQEADGNVIAFDLLAVTGTGGGYAVRELVKAAIEDLHSATDGERAELEPKLMALLDDLQASQALR